MSELNETCRVILETLSKHGELNITSIVKLTGLSFRTINKKLRELEVKGLVTERRYGRLRLIRIRGKM